MTKGLLQVKACILHQLQIKIDEHRENITTQNSGWLKNDLLELENVYQKVVNDDWSYDDIDCDIFAINKGTEYIINRDLIEASVAEYKMVALDLKINDVLK